MTPEQANQIAQLYDQGIKFRYRSRYVDEFIHIKKSSEGFVFDSQVFTNRLLANCALWDFTAYRQVDIDQLLKAEE